MTLPQSCCPPYFTQPSNFTICFFVHSPYARKKSPSSLASQPLSDLHSACFPGSSSSLPSDAVVEGNCYLFTSRFRPMGGCSSSWLEHSPSEASLLQFNKFSKLRPLSKMALCLGWTFPPSDSVSRTAYNMNFTI